MKNEAVLTNSPLNRSAKLGTETLVFLDLGSRRNNDTAQLRSILEGKLRSGRLAAAGGEGGGLEVREPGDNWFRVISGPGQSVKMPLNRCQCQVPMSDTTDT